MKVSIKQSSGATMEMDVDVGVSLPEFRRDVSTRISVPAEQLRGSKLYTHG